MLPCALYAASLCLDFLFMSDTDPSLLGKSTQESVSEIRLDTEMVIKNFDDIALDSDRVIHETNGLPTQKRTHLGNDTKQLESKPVNTQLEQSGLQNQDSASDGIATNSITVEVLDDDEGFGDFNEEGGLDDFQAYNSSSFAAQVPPTMANTYPQFETIIGDKEVEDRLDEMVKDMDIDPLIYAKLKSAFPVFHIQPTEIVDIPNIEVEPFPDFKWNTSRLKQIMEKALLNTRKEVKQALESPKVNEENIEDVRTRQLQNAKQLLEVTEGI